MNKILEGMTHAYEVSFLSSTGDANTRAEAIRAALLWLADNVSDEMVIATLETATKYMEANKLSAVMPSAHAGAYTRLCIAAAIRAAAGGEG